MKGPRELRRWIAHVRCRRGGRNGVIPGYAFDDLTIFKLERCRKWRKRHRRPRDGRLDTA